MNKYFIQILFLILTINITAQSPHGDSFKVDCRSCHNLGAWTIDMDTFHFNHDTLRFALEGMHREVDCINCHRALIFNNTSNQCSSCHTDIHRMSVGNDCARCHSPQNWLVDNIPEIHDENGFPLVGNHNSMRCVDCHKDESNVVFNRIGNDCVNCHLEDYNVSKSPDHVKGAYSKDCLDCHALEKEGWRTDNVDHVFFPLTLGHDIKNCNECHLSSNYSEASPICITCHQSSYENTSNPNHQTLNLNKDCTKCHTTDLGWQPARFDNHNDVYPLNGAHAEIVSECAKCHNGNYNNTPNTCFGCHRENYDNTINPNHNQVQFSTDCTTCHTESSWVPSTINHDDNYFPIYTGKHDGTWNNCKDCHNDPNDFTDFHCTTCHNNHDTDDDHEGISGYIFEDNACLACHPTGDAENTFDHNTTNFQLTGAHLRVDCIQCHSNGYEGTPQLCVECHRENYDKSVNPNHGRLNLPLDCISCHTTETDWKPTTFAQHDDFYVLEGAHVNIASDCISCHNGDYNNTPTTCVGCHIDNYNDTQDPDHRKSQFSTTCTNCHTQNAWVPSTFDHDAQYFPIYTGAHEGEWGDCIDCHTIPGDYSVFTCIKCHTNPETDNSHSGVSGYVFNDNACLACHPSGDRDNIFDHNATAFPLTGEHLNTECLECHNKGFEGTASNCVDCHHDNFEASLNPNHQQLNISKDCASCHSTDANWRPALFANHDDYYELNGAHSTISTDCALCHNGDYVNTPNSCIGCHKSNYDNATNPNHAKAQFSTDCTICHNETEWTPSTFDHDGRYFPIYSGKHEGEWNECIDCHTNPNNITEFSCTNCHARGETNDDHASVTGYIYNDDACLACHPTGDGDELFDHNATAFPLTGAHIGTDCLDCHGKGFEGTSSECADCHQGNYDGSLNPNHKNLNISTDCGLCHTTNADWKPARFGKHDDYYPLLGAHAIIAMDCDQCHQGDYNNTVNTCVSCHRQNYKDTKNPNHEAAQFSTDCTTCHNEVAWIPSSFDHDAENFPIYSGSHEGEWNECVDCHFDLSNYAKFTCVTCHEKMETDENHDEVGGYVYQSLDCVACHPTGDADEGIDHDETGFILTGGHIGVSCKECHIKDYKGTSSVCVDCHKENYDESTNPNHNKLGLSIDCISCHTTEPDWKPATFAQHDNYYELTGAHISISNECDKCHNGDYNNTKTDCKGCHETNYNESKNPNHNNLNIPKDCDNCHTTMADWKPATFAIHDDYYALTGAHETVADNCATCHNGDYNNTPTECVGCHRDNYNGSTNPNHVDLGIPTSCDDCHTTNPDWKPATFDIHDNYYPLTGAHETISNDCDACHNGDYNNTPNECVGCHQSNYDNTTNPNHISLGLSTTCDNCHTTNPDWKPATFDIHDNYYPLNGAHALIANDCDACHNGDYNNTPNTCVGCHQDDYDNTTNPSHSSAQYPTTCEDCHTEDAWVPSTFDHDNQYFPIYSGKHDGEWNLCADCHFNPNDFSIFSCIDCHEHNDQAQVDDDHSGVSGYTYESNACLSCHPDGEE